MGKKKVEAHLREIPGQDTKKRTLLDQPKRKIYGVGFRKNCVPPMTHQHPWIVCQLGDSSKKPGIKFSEEDLQDRQGLSLQPVTGQYKPVGTNGGAET